MTLTGTPYGQTETGAVYTQAAALLDDEFDTSGTPENFCPSCEHAPCVAGARPETCTHRPRFFVRRRLRAQLLELVGEVGGWDNPLAAALTTAIYSVCDTSWVEGHHGDYAYDDLLRILTALRKAKEAQS